MTPAEAIAALEAAYPDYFFTVVQLMELYHNRIPSTQDFDSASKTQWQIIAISKPVKLSFEIAPSLYLAVLNARAKMPLTETQRAIEQVAAQLEVGK